MTTNPHPSGERGAADAAAWIALVREDIASWGELRFFATTGGLVMDVIEAAERRRVAEDEMVALSPAVNDEQYHRLQEARERRDDATGDMYVALDSLWETVLP